MRITESQLRKVVRKLVKEQVEAQNPGLLTTWQQLEQLKPGDQVIVNGIAGTVIKVDGFTGTLSYAKKGTSIRKNIDMGLAVTEQPGETPEIEIQYIGPGAPIKRPRLPKPVFSMRDNLEQWG